MSGTAIDNERARARVQRRCVVVAGEGWSVPGALAGALERRRIETIVVADAASAMVELALGQFDILLIVEPGECGECEQLLAAALTYYPNVLQWQYESGHGSAGRLSAVGGRQGSAAVTGEAEQQLAALASPGRDEDEALDDLAPPLVSAEELAMLLGSDDPGEDDLDDRPMQWPGY